MLTFEELTQATREMHEDEREHFEVAYEYAYTHSNDPRTQNGAVFSGRGPYLCGANRLPCGVKDSADRKLPDEKLKWFIHAEADAIVAAARHGVRTDDRSMYCPWAPCQDCAKLIIQSQLVRLYVHKELMDKTPDEWRESIVVGITMLKEAGVPYIVLSGKIGNGVTHLVRGEIWEP